MKTKQYVEKYNLSKNGFFTNKEEKSFISDLEKDFATLLAKTNPNNDKHIFEQCVKMMKDKFHAINNKTHGFIHYDIWNKFKDEIVSPLRKKNRQIKSEKA